MWARSFDPRLRLSASLYDMAMHHARRSLRAPRVDDPLDEYDRTTSLGAAAEFLAKSTLAGISITLLAGNSTTATLAEFGAKHVTPRSDGDKKKEPPEPTTIGAYAAVGRLNEFRAETTPKIAPPERLFAARNWAIHLGRFPSADGSKAARAHLVTWVNAMLECRRELAQPGDWDEFWSADYAPIATSILEDTFKALQEAFDRLVRHAQATYASLVDDLDPVDRQNRITAIAHRALTSGLQAYAYRCPGCAEHTLHGLYEVRRDVDVDDSDAPNSVDFFVTETAELVTAHRPLCDLLLDRSLVGFTDVKLIRDNGTKVATFEEVAAWQDMMYERDRLLYEHADIHDEPDVE